MPLLKEVKREMAFHIETAKYHLDRVNANELPSHLVHQHTRMLKDITEFKESIKAWVNMGEKDVS